MINLKKRGLGKGLSELGLSELLSDINTPTNANTDLRKLPIETIHPGKYQPRKDMKSEALEELAESIRAQGIIQPIVVRNIAANEYEIIAGERRWRAAQLANLTEVPVVIRNIPDEAAIAMALIENIQREDLNAIEEANALQRLIDEFGMTHQEVAKAVGKSRVTVTNLLRLLSLNYEVKTLLEQNKIEMGHARALLTLSETQQLQVAQTVIAKELSVRETEKLIQRIQQRPIATKKPAETDPNLIDLQKKIADVLGAAVTIQHFPKGNGRLIIEYNSVDEFQGILEHIQ